MEFEELEEPDEVKKITLGAGRQSSISRKLDPENRQMNDLVFQSAERLRSSLQKRRDLSSRKKKTECSCSPRKRIQLDYRLVLCKSET